MKGIRAIALWSALSMVLTLAACGGGASGGAAMNATGGAAMQSAPAAAGKGAAPSVADGASASYFAPAEAEAAFDMAVTESAGANMPAPTDMTTPDWDTEEYGHIQENDFLSAALSPLSTFAADVDTASYANLRRMLLAGEEPPAGAVRLEEMINYFRYDYPEPEGEEPFSVSAQIVPCPWNEKTSLLRLGLQTAQPDWEAMPPSNLVFLIDVSGSMDQWNKLPLVKQAFQLLTEHLRPSDTISVVTYASMDQVVLDGVSGDQGETIQNAIEGLMAGGSTDGSRGILTAYELAREHFIPGGNNRVLLATDGDLNVGVTSEGELVELIQEQKEGGIFLSVLGFGDGNLKDNKLEALADHGDGNYSYIDTLLEARRVLVEEMGGTLFTVAKDVKLQVEFNPEKVAAYRLIGYENRLMDAEDFADDTKDGGEIGAGHRVTVLYELAAPGSGLEVPGVELKYQEATPTGSGEWLTVSVRYKEPEGSQSRLLEYPVGEEQVTDAPSADTAFAACVAQFGMLLRGSEYSGSATYEKVARQLAAIPGLEEDPYRDELLYLVRQQARRG